jgi:hypothetical protein
MVLLLNAQMVFFGVSILEYSLTQQTILKSEPHYYEPNIDALFAEYN